MIALGQTEHKGRGVFAQQAFLPGALIETAPVLVIPAHEWSHIEPTVLYHYVFCWGPNGEHAALAMGLGSFYNHSWQPNAEYVTRLEDGTIDFVALRPIAAGEEITVNYNGEGDDTPVWFEVVS
jgi:SET domain-containing protein